MSSKMCRKFAITFVLAAAFGVAGNYQATRAQGPTATPANDAAVVAPLVKESANEPAPAVKVTFDDAAPGVAWVEVGGQRFKIDTAAKTYARLDNAAPAVPANEPTAAPVAAPVAKAAAQDDADEDDEPGSERYDYRLVNVPTPKRYAKGSLNLYFTHRFSQSLRPLGGDNGSAKAFFGLDGFAVSSFGFYYGITDKLYVGAYRSPFRASVRNSQALTRIIEIGAGYNALHEKKGKSPVSLGFYGSVEGSHNFKDNFTYNLQATVARSVGKYLNVFFAPAVHFNANGQRRFNPPVTDSAAAARLDLGRHTGSFGFGANARVRPSISLLFDYTPRVGFKLGQLDAVFDNNGNIVGYKNISHAAFGFGIEKDTARHSFTLTFSNTQGTTTSRYNSSNLNLSPTHFAIGFNIFRRLIH